jgi:hypothetical protein
MTLLECRDAGRIHRHRNSFRRWRDRHNIAIRKESAQETLMSALVFCQWLKTDLDDLSVTEPHDSSGAVLSLRSMPSHTRRPRARGPA